MTEVVGKLQPSNMVGGDVKQQITLEISLVPPQNV